jgi:hypothetical protein
VSGANVVLLRDSVVNGGTRTSSSNKFVLSFKRQDAKASPDVFKRTETIGLTANVVPECLFRDSSVKIASSVVFTSVGVNSKVVALTEEESVVIPLPTKSGLDLATLKCVEYSDLTNHWVDADSCTLKTVDGTPACQCSGEISSYFALIAEDEEQGLTAGDIAGIVVGSLFGIAIVVVSIFLIHQKKCGAIVARAQQLFGRGGEARLTEGAGIEITEASGLPLNQSLGQGEWRLEKDQSGREYYKNTATGDIIDPAESDDQTSSKLFNASANV